MPRPYGPAAPAIRLSAHAEVTLRERGLSLEWVERTILEPAMTATDPADPAATRSFRRIAAAGGRVLRGVHRPGGPDIPGHHRLLRPGSPAAMKTHDDPETDALYVRLADVPVDGSEEVAPGIVLDFDADHRLVGLEILNATATLAAGAIPNLAAADTPWATGISTRERRCATSCPGVEFPPARPLP